VPSAYLDALHLLARRALTIAECRARLIDRGHSREQIDAAIEHLRETGGLDDGKVARAQAQTAVDIKGRGRLRILRELAARGVDQETASQAVGDVFKDRDERTLVNRAVQKKLRGRPRPSTQELARLYQHLMRQGFTPAVVSAAIRRLRSGGAADPDEDEERTSASE
jgi:regulatory protein